MKKISFFVVYFIVILVLFNHVSLAQSTEFTYQGSLKSGGVNANGNYDFEFALFDALASGAQLGTTTAVNNVTVADGAFSVRLDFGNQFPGAARYLEIRVRQTGGGSLTTLAPRQKITSALYGVKSLTADNATTATTANNALSLGGVAANQYVLTGDVRLSDARNPLPNSPNYIQNTTTQQATSNFNISGDGTLGGTLSANIVNAATQFNLGGSRILSNAGSLNLFAGVRAASRNPTGNSNSFFGNSAGDSTTTGSRNSFFGYSAGPINQTGDGNSAFGANAGYRTTGWHNNSFFGIFSGANSQGNNNTFLGAFSDVYGAISNSTAVGYRALVTQSDSLVLGSINGVNGADADTNVGIGTTMPLTRLDVRGNIFVGLTQNPSAAYNNSVFFANDGGDILNSFRLDAASNNLYIIGRSSPGATTGAGIIFRTGTTGNGESDRVTINPSGTVGITTLGSAGSTSLCRNASNEISTCSSSIRYKSNINSFSAGLTLIKQLRPVLFNWRDGGMLDMGLVAEEVAVVEPLLTTVNDKGETEGVKYDRVGVVLVNAVNEQQLLIEAQQRKIESQQSEIETLKIKLSELDAIKQLVCLQNKTAAICQPENR